MLVGGQTETDGHVKVLMITHPSLCAETGGEDREEFGPHAQHARTASITQGFRHGGRPARRAAEVSRVIRVDLFLNGL